MYLAWWYIYSFHPRIVKAAWTEKLSKEKAGRKGWPPRTVMSGAFTHNTDFLAMIQEAPLFVTDCCLTKSPSSAAWNHPPLSLLLLPVGQEVEQAASGLSLPHGVWGPHWEISKVGCWPVLAPTPMCRLFLEPGLPEKKVSDAQDESPRKLGRSHVACESLASISTSSPHILLSKAAMGFNGARGGTAMLSSRVVSKLDKRVSGVDYISAGAASLQISTFPIPQAFG